MKDKAYRSVPILLSEMTTNNVNGATNSIQILRTGRFNHNGHTFEVTKEILENMIKNFDDDIRGIKIMLDFGHDTEGPAAAWIRSLVLSQDDDGTWGLWADVEWTKNGERAVIEKDYMYISADFHFNYMDNESGRTYGPTLLGAGLTNRPVVKNMKATSLSEDNNNNGEKMDELKKELEEMKKKNKALMEKLAELEKTGAKKELSEKEEDLKQRELKIQLAEDKIKKDAEKAAADKIVADKKAKFDVMLSEGKAVEAQREAYMAGDVDKYAELAADINLSEKGSGSESSDVVVDEKTETPFQDKIMKLAETKMKEDKNLNTVEAIDMILSENKELKDGYAKETSL